MGKSRCHLGWILGVILLIGCQHSTKTPNVATPDAGEVSANPKSDGRKSLADTEARGLCLADPRGVSALDDELRAQQRRVKAAPGNSEGWVLIGRAWVHKARAASDPGFYINVAGCADTALRVEPGNLAALDLHALTLMNDHKFAQARQAAEEILRQEPQNTVALAILSDAFLELGHFEEAASAAQQLVDFRPDMASYSRASYFRWLQGDTENAKLLVRAALSAGRDRRNPEPTAWTLVQAGMLWWNEGNYTEADTLFTEALKWMPEYPAALVGRAQVALSRHQPQPAITWLEKAYRLSPLPATAWLLGDARQMSGDEGGAQAAYKQVVQEGRKSDRLTLALFYATKNIANEEALRLIETERAGRGGIYVEDTYAWVLYRAGKIAEAQAASERARSLGTQDARLLYHAGAIRLAAGDRTGQQLIEKALLLNPQFDWSSVTEAKKVLSAYGNKKSFDS